MDYTPPPDHDFLDGRDPSIKKLYKSLKPRHVEEDTDRVIDARVPYDDLQRSPAPYTGHFQSAFDSGTLTICSRPHHAPVPMAIIKIKNRVKSTGEVETLVSLHVYSDEEEE